MNFDDENSTKFCATCGSVTKGVIVRDPDMRTVIYVDTLCEACLEVILYDIDSEIQKPDVGSIAAVARLPEEIIEKEPPLLGWKACFRGKLYIEEKYGRCPIIGELSS